MGTEKMKFLSFLPILVKAQESSACPSFLTTEDVRYYMVSNSKMTWFSAREQCRFRNITLALPRTADENRKLLAFMALEFYGGIKRIKPFWIGATDAENENYFVDPEGTPITFSSFAEGEPNNSKAHYETGENCVEMASFPDDELHGLLGWNDQACENKNYFACETRTTRYDIADISA